MQQAVSAHSKGRLGHAEELCRSVLRQQSANLAAGQMLGIIALQTGRLEDALALMTRTAEVHPTHAQAHANLASALVYLGRPEDALPHFERALALDPRLAGAINNQGNALRALNRHGQAAESFRHLLEVAPAFDFAYGSRFSCLRECCDWREFETQRGHTLAALEHGERVDRPFPFLSVSDSAQQQLRCARIYAAHTVAAAGEPVWQGERYRHDRIRLAYVSADFHDHVMSHMMAPIYEQHDRKRFDTIGVSLGMDDDSDIVRRGKRALGEFINVGRLSEQQAAELLRKLEVDIAIDLTGYTQGCRPGILARRPAPVQVNFLGFPGTLGVPYIDYVIADEFVVPEAVEAGYSEKIARLPDCFQPNDERRSALEDAPTLTRNAAGLPESGLVLCCFNNSHKLNPAFFDIWMRLLRQAPDSVLWLLGEHASVREHLLAEATARGVGAERLVFAPRVPYPEHLARLKLADLFLDTLPFNAGATAGDALRAGVPVLTCAGEAFAARMTGSLLRAAGLAELITSDPTHYQRRAMELICDAQALAALKSTLTANRRSAPLFDGARYCRHLEAAYLEMSARVANGEPPVSFKVAALR
jgi:protein O-GlcNAc transferase